MLIFIVLFHLPFFIFHLIPLHVDPISMNPSHMLIYHALLVYHNTWLDYFSVISTFFFDGSFNVSFIDCVTYGAV